MKLDNIAARSIETGGKLSVKSALNPMLWLCAIITMPGVTVCVFWKEAPNWFLGFCCLPVVVAVIGFIYFMLADSDKLQSEQYQIQKKSLELVQEKGQKSPRYIDTDNIEAIENPEQNNIKG